MTRSDGRENMATTAMEELRNEGEEDPRVYETVFHRLTDGTQVPPPRPLEQAVAVTRRRLGEVGKKVRGEAVGIVRRVRTRFGKPPGWQLTWQLTWHRPAAPRRPRPMHREPSLFVGIASFAFAFSVAWWTGGPSGRETPRRAPVAAPVVQAAATQAAVKPTPAVAVPAPVQPATFDVAGVLRSAEASDETKLAVVQELAKDPSPAATRALLGGVGADSIYVSMASLRALSGRPCDLVADPLEKRLADPVWQRRAWAARALGASDCPEAARSIASRLAVEPDARVQQQLQLALESLTEPGA